MRLYIDCEFNGGRGELISLALVAEDGREFYEVLDCERPVPWVAENVMPILNKAPITISIFRSLLGAFLRDVGHGQVEPLHIVADHPADLAYFFDALIVDNIGTWTRIPPLIAYVHPGVKYKSTVPHNALEDARAIARMIGFAPKVI